ncbi:MAG: hypothetical protein QG656_1856, partial [Candidatus Hydrogenedentes bacterium]|nr:hypothetical protein [Candidatus Hydrogenedentota bacterium]
DVTASRRAEAERIRLAMAVEQAGESILITDAAGIVVYVNPAFERVTGYASGEAVGQDYRLFNGNAQDLRFHEELWEDLRRGKTWEGHLVNARKDGTLGEEDASSAPVRDHAGQIVNYVAVKRDVTIERALARQLRQSQKMQALGTLAGGIAHDLNNILAVIFAFAEMAKDDLPPGTFAHKNFKKVLNAGMRAKDLVRQILTFSRQASTKPQPIVMAKAVKDTLKLVKVSIPANVAVVKNIDQGAGVVFADETQIHQVVMNLCTNAYQAMQPGGGTMTVSLVPVHVGPESGLPYPALEAGRYTRLTVTDTGCGMDEATKERVFEPFFTTKSFGQGTGLGLATVHGIVTSLGGYIAVESAPGAGATFRVYLPLVDGNPEQNLPGEEPVPAGHGERILLIDDEEDVAALGRQMLTHLGYHVAAHTDPVQALDVFSADPEQFDLIVTDQSMPKLTGVELAQEILQLRPDMPILIVTGFTDTVSPSEARMMGIREYLVKPFLTHELAQAVHRALGPS